MPAPEPEIYVYKIIVDSGGAPCVWNNLLSLALCKPKIRKTAGTGSLVFGFGGKDYEERLIDIARVTTKLVGDAYYRRRRFVRRPDCIYRVENGRPVRKASAKHHFESDHRKKDVGLRFEKAFVLLSNDFRYLGRKGTEDYKKRYLKIARLIDDLTQGHRRHHSTMLRKELMALKADIWRKYRRRKVGLPTEKDRTRPCNQECQAQGDEKPVSNPYTEDHLVEQPAIQLFADLSWATKLAADERFGPSGTIGHTKSEIVIVPRLRAALARLNPSLPADAINSAVVELSRDRSAMSLAAANRDVWELLRDGVKVSVPDHERGGQKTERVKVMDWDNPHANDFLLVSQLTITGDLYT